VLHQLASMIQVKKSVCLQDKNAFMQLK
jgi:hypothetical protein